MAIQKKKSSLLSVVEDLCCCGTVFPIVLRTLLGYMTSYYMPGYFK